MFGGNFAPRGWALCNGQLLSIAQNTALFSILGTTYGGDGRTTFGLPDLRGRLAMHEGTGPGLSPRPLGQRGGTETNTMTLNQMPNHGHSLVTSSLTVPVSSEDADQDEASGHFLANGTFYHNAADATYGNGPINLSGVTGNNGGNQPINNIMPYQCVNYIIALEGTFPSRS